MGSFSPRRRRSTSLSTLLRSAGCALELARDLNILRTQDVTGCCIPSLATHHSYRGLQRGCLLPRNPWCSEHLGPTHHGHPWGLHAPLSWGRLLHSKHGGPASLWRDRPQTTCNQSLRHCRSLHRGPEEVLGALLHLAGTKNYTTPPLAPPHPMEASLLP